MALRIAALRNHAWLSQKDLAKLLKIFQQQISRLESPGYEGHSLSTLRRVAKALHARVRVTFEPENKGDGNESGGNSRCIPHEMHGQEKFRPEIGDFKGKELILRFP